jgi:hypothetical protein
MGMIQTAVGPIYVPDDLAPPPMAQPIPGVAPMLEGAPGAPSMGISQVPPLAQVAPVDFTPTEDLQALGQAADAGAGALPAATFAGDRGAQKRVAAQQAYQASPEGQIDQATQGAAQVIQGQADIAGEAGNVAAAEADEAAVLIDERNAAAQVARDANAAQAKERAEGLQRHTDAYDKAVEQEAKYKVDDGRRWNNLSTGRKVLAGISVILSGLGEALQHKSGPNPAISMIMDALKDDVAAQVREREQLGRVVDRRRNSIDMYRQQTNDLREAGNLKLAEEYKRTADQLEATAAKYASPKAKLNAMNAAAQFDLEAQKLLGASAEAKFNRDVQRQQVAISRAGVGAQYARLNEDKRQFDENLKIRKNELLIEAGRLEQAGQAAQAKALKEEAARNNELAMPAPPKVVMGADGKPVLNEDGTPKISRAAPLVNEDQTTWNAPSKEIRAELGKKYAAAAEVTALIDEALAIRDRVGGESAAANSEDYQKLKVLEARLQLLAKSGTQGMSSDKDMEALRSALGAADLTSFRSRAAGLEEGRARTIDELNTSMRYLGNYTGGRIDFDSNRYKGSTTTAEDQAFKSAVTDSSGSDRARIQVDYANRAKTDPAGAAKARDAALADARVPAATRQLVDVQAATLTSSGASAQDKIRARMMLEKVVEQGQTEAIRNYAQNALQTGGILGGAGGEATGGVTGTSTARDTSYGAPAAKGK